MDSWKKNQLGFEHCPIGCGDSEVDDLDFSVKLRFFMFYPKKNPYESLEMRLRRPWPHQAKHFLPWTDLVQEIH